MELNEEQLKIVNSTEKKILVNAGAGAGKTRLLTERIKHLLDDGNSVKDIVAITFTNNAADEMRARLGACCTGMFIGTIHSYANQLLLASGISTADLLSKEQFNQLFERIKDHPEVLKPVKHLLVDEGQDTSDTQLNFIKMINPENFFMVFDVKQSIFEFNGANPNNMFDLMNDSNYTTYRLLNNYRNDENILNYAKNIIRPNGMAFNDRSVSMTGKSGTVANRELSPIKIVEGIQKHNSNWGDWFILCRTNAEVDEMKELLDQYKIPNNTFKRSELTTNELNKKMKEDTVKVLTIHAAKGLEADNVVVIGARFYNIEERCISYVAATRARHLLIWTQAKKRKTGRDHTFIWEK